MTTNIVSPLVAEILLTRRRGIRRFGRAGAEAGRGVGEFEDATIRVERNATDGDTEIVMTAKPLTDNGLVRLTDPVAALAQGRRGRSAAPHARLARVPVRDAGAARSAILEHYPEGDYLYFGTATNGQRFVGSASFVARAARRGRDRVPGRRVRHCAGRADDRLDAPCPMPRSTSSSSRTRVQTPSNRSRSSSARTRRRSRCRARSSCRAATIQVGVASVHENGNVVFVGDDVLDGRLTRTAPARVAYRYSAPASPCTIWPPTSVSTERTLLMASSGTARASK